MQKKSYEGPEKKKEKNGDRVKMHRFFEVGMETRSGLHARVEALPRVWRGGALHASVLRPWATLFPPPPPFWKLRRHSFSKSPRVESFRTFSNFLKGGRKKKKNGRRKKSLPRRSHHESRGPFAHLFRGEDVRTSRTKKRRGRVVCVVCAMPQIGAAFTLKPGAKAVATFHIKSNPRKLVFFFY